MKKALLVVDIQKDFTEGGALGCDGGKALAKTITTVISSAKLLFPQDVLVISSQDWHDPNSDNGGHFALNGAEPDFKNTWVPHCVAGSPGAEYQEPLKDSMFDYRILKGQGKPAYSAFEGTEATTGETLEQILHKNGIEEVLICGIATDYCVKETALDAKRLGFDTILLLSGCVPVNKETEFTSIKELVEHKIEVIFD